MQTVKTLIRRRALRRLIWVDTVYQYPFYGTLGLNRSMDIEMFEMLLQGYGRFLDLIKT